MIHLINPVAKPRMTQRDRWKKRKCVMAYLSYKDQIRSAGIEVNAELQVTFHLPMPSSWSRKKREKMRGRPHQSRPDIDNLCKALMDAALKEDSHIWHLDARKRWADEGAIEIHS